MYLIPYEQRYLQSCSVTVVVLLLQYLALRSLWVSEVHHLIKQFVDDDKVVANTLFLQDFEVFREDLHDFVEEEEDFGRIGVLLCQREDIKVAVTDVKILDTPWLISKMGRKG